MVIEIFVCKTVIDTLLLAKSYIKKCPHQLFLPGLSI